MTDKPRYQLRANSAALTRLQWWIVGMSLFVAAVGAVLALAGRPFGTILMSLAALAVGSTAVFANGRGPSPSAQCQGGAQGCQRRPDAGRVCGR